MAIKNKGLRSVSQVQGQVKKVMDEIDFRTKGVYDYRRDSWLKTLSSQELQNELEQLLSLLLALDEEASYDYYYSEEDYLDDRW